MGAQAAVALASGGQLGFVPEALPSLASWPLGEVPTGLTLDRVARSHGWCGLPPYGYDASAQHLHRVLQVGEASLPVWVDAAWTIHCGARVDVVTRAAVSAQLRWCLGLDDDLSGAPPVVQATRMLRSPTVWEDLVKTLLTTNCSWAATIGMVSRLVETLGTAGAFPSPATVLEAGEDHLRGVVRVGYRTGSLLGLATAVDDGSVDPQAWRSRDIPDSDVVSAVLALPGFGPYAAEGMLGLLGRPRGLAVDSWIRARLGGVTAAEIRARYEPAGRWGGALLWQDVTADWFT